MLEISYSQVVSEINQLSLTDQLRLLEEMASLIRRKTIAGTTRSILELQGKGKEIWEDIDVRKYLDEERTSWNG
ncbi:MAG: hypothetical protein A2511_00290 [Deltaproteobacteria bacterium RIFOXYD12_FULL_50_9]|nr:MAG: hypothetical protein A2511_00290 [Deltaproteobacteria bacterium RIFOXYD12_FULL_50_9]